MVKNQSWRGPGASLEALGGQYRKMRRAPGFSGPSLGAVLAASWAVLAASWGRLGGLGGLLGPSWARLGGRNRIPSRLNSDPEVDQNFDAFGDRLFRGFWWILLPKMEPRCLQKPPEIDVNLERLFFQKTSFSNRKTMILVVLEAQLRTA